MRIDDNTTIGNKSLPKFIFRDIPLLKRSDMEQELEEWSSDGDHISDHEKANNIKKAEKQEEGEEEISVEKIFECKEVPSWREQLTMRGFAVSLVLSVLFTFIAIKINLSIGIVPSYNVSAGLLGFFFISVWTKFLDKSGLLKQPFTRQENTVIQTCVVASSGIAFSGGFGSYLLGMSEVIAEQSENAGGNQEYKNPAVAWMIGFLLVVSFRGLFTILLLRKTMIIDFKLAYPSGTATAHLINSFHAPQGAKHAKKQIRALSKFFSFSFFWSFFQWFFGAGDDCGFESFPTFGLKAYKYRFYFDFSATMVGVGMICPHVVNISLLLGGILSWGLMWPLIETRKGDWYPAELPSSNVRSLQGYKIFITMSMILGDTLYLFFKVLSQTLLGLCYQFGHKYLGAVLPIKHSLRPSPQSSSLSYNDRRRTRFFLEDQIPTSFTFGGYVAIAAISTVTLPYIFPQLKWYYIMVIYTFSPVMAFANAYGCGLTDWSFAANYGKLTIFAIGAWAGAAHGGVITGLAACGVMMNIVSTASDLMQDFKTGYLTLASPRSMFVSQLIGTTMGCVISPCVFWLFYKAFDDLGQAGSEYPAPFALVYRNMAVLGVEGISNLPKNCFILCCVFFGAAILINLVRDAVDKRRAQYIPIPMAMAIPFYLGPYFAIDMCVGSLILFAWQRINKAKADAFGPAVASGLICGEGIWNLPSTILALAGVKQPICMKFVSWATNAKVDTFLGS